MDFYIKTIFLSFFLCLSVVALERGNSCVINPGASLAHQLPLNEDPINDDGQLPKEEEKKEDKEEEKKEDKEEEKKEDREEEKNQDAFFVNENDLSLGWRTQIQLQTTTITDNRNLFSKDFLNVPLYLLYTNLKVDC